MRLIQTVDERILALFTKFSHWFQRLTGKTNFSLARLCLGPYGIGLLTIGLGYWLPLLPMQPPLVVSVAMFLSFVLIPFRVYVTHEAEKSFQDNPSIVPQMRFPEQSGDPLQRVLFLLTSPYTSLLMLLVHQKNKQGILLLSLIAGATWGYHAAYGYFLLVTPLPPGKSKVRQWIEEFHAGFGKRQPLPSKNR